MSQQNVIAIDGPAASGKSTVAAGLAKLLSIPYINTGNLYRAVALAALRAGIRDGAGCGDAELRRVLDGLRLDYAANREGEFELGMNGEFPGAELRKPEVAELASTLSARPMVREFLLRMQRDSAKHGLIVMEGRDIGTVVFPAARYKFFVTATPEERARRRLAQSGETPDGATLAEVAAAIAARDERDATRAIAPLRPAPEAEVVDTTGMAVGEAARYIYGRIAARPAKGGETCFMR